MIPWNPTIRNSVWGANLILFVAVGTLYAIQRRPGWRFGAALMFGLALFMAIINFIVPLVLHHGFYF
jgi:hypothetical protein